MRKLILAIAALTALLLSAGAAQAYHSELASIEGEDMTGAGRVVDELDTDATSGGSLRRLENNGSVSADLTIAEPATHITIYARAGQQCGGVWPRFSVRVDDQLIGTVVVDSVAWDPSSLPVDLAPGTHHIDLNYVNDFSAPDCERWLRIDRVELRHEPWRAFPKDSIWNRPASEKGTLVANPFPDNLWLTYGDGLLVGGGPCNSSDHDFEYRKPIYFADENDPVTTIVNKTIPSWDPRGELRWDGRPIPLPRGVKPAEGTDGHLVIVSADRKTAFEFWRATSVSVLGITAATVTMYDLTGPGYSDIPGNNAARGSGMPVVNTALRAEEAYYGLPPRAGVRRPERRPGLRLAAGLEERRRQADRSSTASCSCCARTSRSRTTRRAECRTCSGRSRSTAPTSATRARTGRSTPTPARGRPCGAPRAWTATPSRTS